jgi:hypothetical protein
VIAPGLDGALSLVGSFVSRRYSLRNYFVFSEKRIKASACLIVKYDIRNDMAKVAEKTECSDVGFNIRFGGSVAKELNVDIVFEQENQEVFETFYGRFRVPTRSINESSIASTKRSNVEVLWRFRAIKEIR